MPSRAFSFVMSSCLHCVVIVPTLMTSVMQITSSPWLLLCAESSSGIRATMKQMWITMQIAMVISRVPESIASSRWPARKGLSLKTTDDGGNIVGLIVARLLPRIWFESGSTVLLHWDWRSKVLNIFWTSGCLPYPVPTMHGTGWWPSNAKACPIYFNHCWLGFEKCHQGKCLPFLGDTDSAELQYLGCGWSCDD